MACGTGCVCSALCIKRRLRIGNVFLNGIYKNVRISKSGAPVQQADNLMKETAFHAAPVWLTKDYLESVLRKYKQDNGLRLTKMEVRPATAKGDNYASVMTRIQVEFVAEQGSYIAKTTYEHDPFVAGIVNAYDVYNTEMLMYEKILPKLSGLLREIGDEDKLFANTIHVDYAHAAIISEDLAVSQFVIADRIAGMDEAHAKLALKKLAKMHATAAVLNERMPGVLPTLSHGIFNRHTRGFTPYFESMIEVCANYAGDSAALVAYYKQKLLKLQPHVVELATRCYDAHDGHFHTLIHADFWTNNIMLRYDHDALQNGTKAIKDILLIDFQFSCWASPAVDLHYFFNTSLPNELRMHRQDELLQHYHGVLVDALRQLRFGGHMPSLHELCVQMEAGRFYAVTSSLVVQPVMINDKTEEAEFANLLGNNERARNFRNILYSNKVVQQNADALLPFFDRRGLLDVSD